MLSEKYLAGFIDADGHLSVRVRVGATPDLELSIAQNRRFAEPLTQLQEMFGGYLRERPNLDAYELSLRAGPARQAMERLKKYMVLKRHQAEDYIDLVDRSAVVKTAAEQKELRDRVKAIRRYGARRQPNYPSRKWMAGYIDGDGCFAVKVCKKTGYAYPFLTILAAKNYTVGVLLLQKAFGGRIRSVGDNAIWDVWLTNPSKLLQISNHCGRHLVLKYPQMKFLEECAKRGNFRDGKGVHSGILLLNAQQHRLSDPDLVVSNVLENVRFDIPKRRQGRPPGKRQSSP